MMATSPHLSGFTVQLNELSCKFKREYRFSTIRCRSCRLRFWACHVGGASALPQTTVASFEVFVRRMIFCNGQHDYRGLRNRYP
ncbi:hypothetical protein AcV5_003508 [Taiwanofungus camphoratus]|nr:hypothetical protein AcV5_003508 [Antrodia cinnamomea]